MSDIKHLDIAEFRSLGYLQEVNRQFFHPLGLAFEVVVNTCEACRGRGRRAVSGPGAGVDDDIEVTCPDCHEGEVVRLGGIWDYREDPEGILFAEDIDTEKLAFVKAEFEKRSGRREAILAPGRTVQEPGDNVEPPEVS